MPTLKTLKDNPPSSYLTKLAIVESGNNPKAKARTSSASGAFQFLESTWRDLNNKYKLGYTLDDRFDPVKSKKVADLLTKENENNLRPVLGRELNDGERYLGHFLGTQGSKELLSSYLKNPNESIGNVVGSGALKANKSVFLNKDGSQKTVGDVYNWAAKKMSVQPTYTNSVAPYLNQQPTQTINYLQIPQQTTTFASVPDNEPQKGEKEETDIETEKVEKETNFLKELENLQKEDYAHLQPEQKIQQQQAPQVDYMQQYEQISQFIDNGNEVAQQGGINQFKKKPFQLQDVRNLTQKDNTQVNTQKFRPLQQLNVRNKTDKEIAAEREAKIQASVEAQKTPYTRENWRQQLAAETSATGDKLRVSNEPNFFDDYLNPAAMIGEMASNLGQAPLQAQQSDSNLPYFTSIGTPLIAGAIGGIGTKTTGQFVNSLANPLAGTGELIDNLGNKYLSNAYKLNPKAFKPQQDNFYRQVDDETFKEGLESGLIRGKQEVGFRGTGNINLNRNFGDVAYYNKNSLYYPDNTNLPYLYESKHPEDFFTPMVNNRTRGLTRENTNVRVSNSPIDINDPLINTYKKDWLQGYKKMQEGGQFTENEVAFLSEIDNTPVSPNGLYEYPNQKVKVPTTDGRITMKGINYDVLGIDEYGNRKLMKPGGEYQYKGKTIMEIPFFKK